MNPKIEKLKIIHIKSLQKLDNLSQEEISNL